MVRARVNRRDALRGLGAMIASTMTGCATTVERPASGREFRGAWIASVANIDWPSRPGLSADAQRDEARRLVETARLVGLNALILQVRPAADAMYPSRLEPWSEYLTGEQGRAPEPYYDPLAFWIGEAHGAGLELHAWFNPFRARHPSAHTPLAQSHVANTRPGIVKAYGEYLWMDPGQAGATDRALEVILDVALRYDVDGIHIDDYFYPYPIENLAFPDDESWVAYLASGGTLRRDDWRRANVNGMIERLYREVHRLKPKLRVGISPFGIGRPDRRPAGVAGFSQYDAIYADVELWLEKGWLDYLAPQLYWKRDAPGQAFATLLDYWQSQNPLGRPIWPGLFTSRIEASEPSWPTEEIVAQIALARSRGTGGHIHFSISAIAQNRRGIAEQLRAIYA